jgi:hypothetical protein
MKNITYIIAGQEFTAAEIAEINADMERYEREQEDARFSMLYDLDHDLAADMEVAP